jgi:hypothetical protein
MLRRKEQIATLTDRCIVHEDCDEVRRSPWTEASLRDGLYIAERMGFTAVDFTVCNFRPLNEHFVSGDDPESYFRHFEFGSRPGHFLQIKAWGKVLKVSISQALAAIMPSSLPNESSHINSF